MTNKKAVMTAPGRTLLKEIWISGKILNMAANKNVSTKNERMRLTISSTGKGIAKNEFR